MTSILDMTPENYLPYVTQLVDRAYLPLKESILRHLISLEDPRITRAIIIEQKYIPEDVLLELADSELTRIFRPLARRKDLPEEVVAKLLSKKDGVVTTTLIEEGVIPVEKYGELVEEFAGDIYIAKPILENKRTPKDIIEKLWVSIKKQTNVLDQFFASNPNTPVYILENISKQDKLTAQTSAALCNNPKSTHQIFKRLSNNSESSVRYSPAISKRTPTDIVLLMLLDPDTNIGRIAANNLKERELTPEQQEKLEHLDKVRYGIWTDEKMGKHMFQFSVGKEVKHKNHQDLELLKRLKGYLQK